MSFFKYKMNLHFFLVWIIGFTPCLTFSSAFDANVQASDTSNTGFSTDSLIIWKKTELEEQLGRKLKMKERLGLFLYNRQIRKAKKKGLDVPPEMLSYDKVALAGFAGGVVGILTLIFGGIIASPVLAAFGSVCLLLAAILSPIGLGRVKKRSDRKKGKGFAIAGMVLGFLFVAYIIALIVAISLYL